MKDFSLDGNTLKILALIAMTLDHVGYVFFPDVAFFRIIGRIVFPIFAYMIAEGCFYTRNKVKYFGLIFGLGLFMQVVYYLYEGSLYQCILISYSIAIIIIYAIINYMNKKDALSLLFVFAALGLALFLSVGLKRLIADRDYTIDYGFFGILLPPLIYVGKTKWQKLWLMVLGLVMLSIDMGGVQWFCLLSLPLIMLYNGKRGRYSLKYLFYIYYPLHLGIIGILGEFLNKG